MNSSEVMIVTFWLTTALSLLLVELFQEEYCHLPAALIAGLSIGFVNSIIKPILSQLSLPLTT